MLLIYMVHVSAYSTCLCVESKPWCTYTPTVFSSLLYDVSKYIHLSVTNRSSESDTGACVSGYAYAFRLSVALTSWCQARLVKRYHFDALNDVDCIVRMLYNKCYWQFYPSRRSSTQLNSTGHYGGADTSYVRIYMSNLIKTLRLWNFFWSVSG